MQQPPANPPLPPPYYRQSYAPPQGPPDQYHSQPPGFPPPGSEAIDADVRPLLAPYPAQDGPPLPPASATPTAPPGQWLPSAPYPEHMKPMSGPPATTAAGPAASGPAYSPAYNPEVYGPMPGAHTGHVRYGPQAAASSGQPGPNGRSSQVPPQPGYGPPPPSQPYPPPQHVPPPARPFSTVFTGQSPSPPPPQAQQRPSSVIFPSPPPHHQYANQASGPSPPEAAPPGATAPQYPPYAPPPPHPAMGYAVPPPYQTHPIPAPPPAPQGYQTEVQQNLQGQTQHTAYSQQPMTHRYDPEHPSSQHQRQESVHGPGQAYPQPPPYYPEGSSGVPPHQQQQIPQYQTPTSQQPPPPTYYQPAPSAPPHGAYGPPNQGPSQTWPSQPQDSSHVPPPQSWQGSTPQPPSLPPGQPPQYHYPASGAGHRMSSTHTVVGYDIRPQQDPPRPGSSSSVSNRVLGAQHQMQTPPSEPIEGRGTESTVSPMSLYRQPSTKQVPVPRKPVASTNGISASALPGEGRPSDWEYFGTSAEDESVDDIEPAAASQPESAGANVRTAGVVTASPASAQAETGRSEIMTVPTQSNAAPPAEDRPGSSGDGAGSVIAPSAESHNVPTPAPKPQTTVPSPGRPESSVSAEEAPTATVRPSTPGTQATPSPVRASPQAPSATAQSFVIDDGSSFVAITPTPTSAPAKEQDPPAISSAPSLAPAVQPEMVEARKEAREGVDSLPTASQEIIMAEAIAPSVATQVPVLEAHTVAQVPGPQPEVIPQEPQPAAPAPKPQPAAPAPESQPAAPAPEPQPLVVAPEPQPETAHVPQPQSLDSGPSDPIATVRDPTAAPPDAYPDLHPWFRNSLARYAAMLHEECHAESDEERTRIFTDFMMKESRMRGVRYGPAIGLISESGRSRRNSAQKASVAETPVTRPVSSEPAVSASPPAQVEHAQVVSQPAETQETMETPRSGRISPIATAESPGIAESAEEIQYSPGGRPLLPASRLPPQRVRQLAAAPAPKPGIASEDTVAESSTSTSPAKSLPDSPANHAPMPVEPARPSTPCPDNGGAGRDVASPYKPFRIDAGGAGGGYRPYSPAVEVAPLKVKVRSDSIEHDRWSDRKSLATKRTSTDTPLSPQYPRLTLNPASPRSGIDEYPNALLPSALKPKRPDVAAPSVSEGTAVTAELGREVDPVAPGGEAPDEKHLAGILSHLLPKEHESSVDQNPHIVALEEALQHTPEDFTFLEKLATDWEKKVAATREEHEGARRKRQEEQEAETDRLFSESQIGYGDISALEKDFQKAEAERKAREDTDEFDGFVTEVFERAYHQLQEQITYLMQRYAHCVELMTQASVGKEALEAQHTRPELAQIVEVFLALHDKVEARHQRVLESVLERDKRYKKTVVEPLVAAGKLAEMKQMEKHFDESEKKAVLDAATKRQRRATGLMDAIETHVMKGLGQELDYMEALGQAIRQIADVCARPSSAAEPKELEALDHEFDHVQTVLRALTATCERLIRGGHNASVRLHASKHDVDLAAARLAGRSLDAIKALREEKQKDEEGLTKDVEHRVATVCSDRDAVASQIDALRPRVKELERQAAERAARKPEHEERIKKALEAAKKRNAAKVGAVN
ncbi:MAG: hypothetical protein M1838_003145 [Thelocarpon superellum]|nr:MAG: hypothetical protein M1838_003145 [Thelocarpon superellum]